MRWRGLRFDDEERVWKWPGSESLSPGTGLVWGWTVRSARGETHGSSGIHSLDIEMSTLSPDVDKSCKLILSCTSLLRHVSILALHQMVQGKGFGRMVARDESYSNRTGQKLSRSSTAYIRMKLNIKQTAKVM